MYVYTHTYIHSAFKNPGVLIAPHSATCKAARLGAAMLSAALAALLAGGAVTTH